jgi:hypothetical protein
MCNNTLKKMFPLETVLNYLFHKPVKSAAIRQSFVWILIHIFLNVKPRFEKINPLVYSIEDSTNKQNNQKI